MSVFAARLYGDPANVVDELRKAREAAKRQAARDRLHKGRRIRALVKEVMRKGGGN